MTQVLKRHVTDYKLHYSSIFIVNNHILSKYWFFLTDCRKINQNILVKLGCSNIKI